jgi:hypothetical protein
MRAALCKPCDRVWVVHGKGRSDRGVPVSILCPQCRKRAFTIFDEKELNKVLASHATKPGAPATGRLGASATPSAQMAVPDAIRPARGNRSAGRQSSKQGVRK